MKNSIVCSSLALIAATLLPQLALAFDSSAIDLKLEVRANYRDSEDLSLAVPFPPGAFQSTVDPGDHGELSRVTLLGKVQFSEHWQMLAKLDAIDLYERNPTSSDKEFDIDTLILRGGTKHTHGLLPEQMSFYGQFGKFGPFERQEDRHIESYGLVSTAFNRLEDAGFEFGVDFASGFYSKLAYTTGAPVFFRDPNALAGDNGVDQGSNNDTAEHNTGFAILYDAEIEELDLSENPETSFGLGYRWIAEDGATRVNVLLNHNERDLADTIELEGTGYGGDLDLLVVVPSELQPGTITSNVGLPIEGNKKQESGVTLWLYHQNFALFSQYVTQEIASLKRDGWEVELSYLFNEVPFIASITPAIRMSRLRPDFKADDSFPAVSVTWDWSKLDFGADFEINQYFNLIVEHSDNEFVRQGRNESYGETRVTALVSYDF